jgi:hypothetical protein
MLFAADRSGIPWVILTVVVWLALAQVLKALNYKARAEIPTQENVVKRIAEHQGAQRFAWWKVVNGLISVGFWTAAVLGVLFYLLKDK